MLKSGKIVSATVIMSALLAALVGCEKQAGPAEQTGKDVDRAVEKVGQQIEKAGDSIQDMAKGAKK